MILVQMDDDTHLICEESEVQPDPLKIRLKSCAVVRYWGTTEGRGQLALSGPSETTKIDVEPLDGELNWLHIRRIIRVSQKAEAAWKAKFSKK